MPVIHVDIDHSKANDLGISIRSIGEPWLCWSANTCQPVQPRRTLLRSDPEGAADPGDADPLLRQKRRGPAGVAVQPRHAQDSDRAECGLKIFGIAVGLLMLMVTVALLSIH